ncbi:mediator of RNA polymerase II transcription subunit 13-like isoform X1 [Tripterygium wilfordii]|uniref:mediator of RNA polymerase II transcription subunit 13-like isoform X1 n=1 Tax=Tripterygium wilfordii TaxID=458696 RepID=UPI0018F84F68|nr:mediator of RNA polymerase II transcription subunit 13-like isoform X1 [Tripterygium wilfordii]
MWTNVFKIADLRQVSWFQFLPQESDYNSLPDKSVKAEKKDAATLQVISAHLQLQKEGFLSTWTSSFVGPWDPSQGLHNPDEKIKLWLFLPERHSSVVETAQPAVSRLKVVSSGLWLAPGDSEEVAAALSQALRNRIERALSGLSYVRFGDVFTKSHLIHSEELFWRGQPTVEFIFAANEEAIFVHVITSAKHIRALSSGDMEQLLKRSSNGSGYRLPVIVSPHGMRGWLTGSCPNDLVKQVYLRSRTANGSMIQHYVSQGSGCQLRGKNCYVEVTIGCPRSESEKALQSNSNSIRNLPKYHVAESPVVGRGDQKVSSDHLSASERTFIYPAEAVVVPVLQTSSAKSSLKRFWLQNWIGPSLPGSSFFMHCAGNEESAHGSWIETSRVHMECCYNSSSNSNSSSVSSISSSSSDSAYKMTTGSGDLEADADSLTCRKSGLCSSDQLENDSSKLGSKRPRTSTTESFGQAGTITNAPMQDAYKSDFGSAEVNNSAITGVANEQIGSHWDWDDDDDRGVGMDIQALLSEFGDFGDFFENDALPFGEPPGTAESQALMFPTPECGDGDGSTGMMDVSDQMLLPVGFTTFDNFNTPPAVTEECPSKNQEVENCGMSIDPIDCPPASLTSEFDHIIKAEALMTFAPEYGVVETPTSELSSSIFRNPYVPKSRKMESLNANPDNYVYGATPPSSPCLDVSGEKAGTVINPKTCPGRHDANGIHQSGKYYTHVESGKTQQDKKPFTHNGSTAASDGMATSALSTFNSTNAVNSIQSKISEGTLGTEHILLSMKTVLATEVECIMFQAFMCKMRHILLSSSVPAPPNLSRLTGSAVLNQVAGDRSTMTDNVSSRYEVKKKESIPVRIAGDFDGGVQDGHLNAPVGVWRSVGVAKVSKPTNSPSIEVSPSLPHQTFTEEGILSYQQRQHLMDLLDGMPLLVQQATSFVDVALDTDCGDGPYGWLALQEQWRRGFSCGPSMVHAGCGGTLASCHSLDIAGVELIDPLSADIHPSSVISLLQSEIKTALKSAFGNLDGPLPVIDWCKGRSQSCDVPMTGDGSFAESTISEYRDSSSTITLSVGEPMSPAHSSAGSSTLKVTSATDGAKVDETCQRRSSQEIELEQQSCGRLRPTLFVLPSPAILVGYQDDWLKTSACSLQFWEKAPLEPYAMQKHITYNVICPDIDPLISAATDFFQQLGTVYETCKLGTHSPHSLGNHMEIDSGKLASSGFVLLDCPRSMKIESSNASLVGSISDYLLSLSNGWDMTSYLKSLTKAIKALKIGQCLSTNPKEGISSPCMVIYVVCPFPEPIAVLQTVVASSIAAGSVVLASERERRSVMQSQVGKALSCSAAVDEALVSNALALSGFSVPKLVLQIITVDAIFRVTTPALNELVILKETAFTIYNKARRIPRGCSNDAVQSSLSSTRSHSVLTQMTSVPGMWKDCLAPRVTGTSLPREGELDAGLRSGNWDNSWQTTRSMGSNCDPNRNGEFIVHDEIRYMFEPLFILAEPGSLEHAVSPLVFGNSASESSKPLVDDGGGGFIQSTGSAGTTDSGPGSQLDVSEPDGFGSGCQRTLPSMHCCYGWTEDWRWLACVWTDARGELLDSHIFPFGGISSRQDTKGLQCLFVQILQQGCQILQACSSSDTGASKPRDLIIARIGSFYELEYLEWQKAIYSVGGSDVKKWPLQLRRSVPDGMPANNNGSSLQQQDMSLIQDRALPSSPSPLYSSHSKTSGFMKGGLGQPNMRKQLMGSHVAADNSRGMLQWLQSISFAAISMDHSLHLVLQADSLSSDSLVGIDGKSGAGGTQGVNGMGPSSYLEGFTPVKSLGSTSAAYMLIPSPSMRFLPPTPLQLPTCLTAESPPLAHLLHSKGFAIPLSTGFVVSKAVPSMKKDCRSNSSEEWPSVLSVSLIDYYGSNNIPQDKILRGIVKQGGRTPISEAKDFEIETHFILESIAAELHALSWMTVSPAYLERRTALPFHCDMVLRLRRLLHFADKELSRQPDSSR